MFAHRVLRVFLGQVEERIKLGLRRSLHEGRAASRDLRSALFARLRERATGKMIKVIEDWEPISLEDDRIPIRDGDRKTTFKVRQLARQIMAELGETAPSP